MSALTSARKALETQLAGTSGLPAVAWESVEFDVPEGQNWVRSTFQPIQRRGGSVGATAPLLHEGLYLIDVFSPKGTGPKVADDLADAILARFSRGLSLSDASFTVRLRHSERGQGITDAPWYFIPITVSWFMHEI